MIKFPNIKINLGLHILAKRSDGYHDLESVFYPVQLCDALEVVESKKTLVHLSGQTVAGSLNDNLCYKAYELLKSDYPLSPISIYLHKIIPMGAGLGGGSSDGAFMIMLLNEKFNLKLSVNQMNDYAAKLGSDCPFFILNKPAFVTGRGERYKPIDINLKGYFILIVHPGIHVSTKDAFTGVIPRTRNESLENIILQLPINQWEGTIKNQFEETVFEKYPIIKNIKAQLYDMGAIYASMSGSGSAIYGLFKKEIAIPANLKKYFTFQQKL